MKQISKLTSGLPTLGKFITSNRTFQAYAATAQKFGGQAKGGALWAVPCGLYILWLVLRLFQFALPLPPSSLFLTLPPSPSTFSLAQTLKHSNTNRMVAPALTDNFRSSLGLPKLKESLPSQAKYMLEEIDQMPVKR